MTIKIGIAPIGWSNDDLPELGGHIPFEQCISEMAQAGYAGCEVGNKFPRDTVALQNALQPHQLDIASAWYSLYFTEDRAQETIDGFVKHMHFLKTMGAKVVVVCECGHSIQGKPLSVLANKPIFTKAQWQLLIDGLHHIGELAKAEQMTVVYHYHMGTGVQYEEEIDYLMQATDPELVSLLLDTGHSHFAGHDPLTILNKHTFRIEHVHLKDIRADILQQTANNALSFLDAVKAGVFTVPGDGCINWEPILNTLLEQDYTGWWIVEAEQDPDKANPLAYAQKAREFIWDTVGL